MGNIEEVHNGVEAVIERTQQAIGNLSAAQTSLGGVLEIFSRVADGTEDSSVQQTGAMLSQVDQRLDEIKGFLGVVVEAAGSYVKKI